MVVLVVVKEQVSCVAVSTRIRNRILLLLLVVRPILVVALGRVGEVPEESRRTGGY